MKKLVLFIFFLISFQSYSQGKIYKYYFHINEYNAAPTFIKINESLVYNGSNINLQSFLSNYNIISFYQAFPSSNRALNLEVFAS